MGIENERETAKIRHISGSSSRSRRSQEDGFGRRT